MERRTESRKKMYILLVVIFLFMSVYAYSFFTLEPTKKPMIEEKIGSRDFNYIYNIYVTSAPEIANRPFYGNPSVSINFIAFLDFNSSASRYFLSEIFPQLQEEFINTGKAKFYQKNYVTLQDLGEKNDNFKYALSLLCVGILDKEEYYPFYFDLFNISDVKGINNLLDKHNIPKKEFNECAKKGKVDDIVQDASEIEAFGFIGINQRFYIGIGRDNTILDGVPDYAKFRKTIKQYGYSVGD